MFDAIEPNIYQRLKVISFKVTAWLIINYNLNFSAANYSQDDPFSVEHNGTRQNWSFQVITHEAKVEDIAK